MLHIVVKLFHRGVSSEVKLPGSLHASFVILNNLYFVIDVSLNESIRIYLMKLFQVLKAIMYVVM